MNCCNNQNLDNDPESSCPCCCSASQPITFDPCAAIQDFTVENVTLGCQGRLLKIRVDLDRVCIGRDINIGVLVCEGVGNPPTFFIRGFKACTVTVPPVTPGQTGCRDNFRVDEFCFVLPEESICNPRNVVVKVIAHYSSFNFPFCVC